MLRMKLCMSTGSRLQIYRRQTLVERYGVDIAMPDVLNDITACERNERLSTDRCRAYFAELGQLLGQ